MIKFIIFKWKTPVELTNNEEIISLFSAENKKQKLLYDNIESRISSID